MHGECAAAYVMAGGASSRFGEDKALVKLGGKPMLARMHELIRDAAIADVIVVGDAKKYGRFEMPCIADRWPGEGPLGGIITALLNSQEHLPDCEWNLIVSCDMPFLTEAWLARLSKRATASSASVVLPHSATGPEPLCACYRTTAAEQLREAFEKGIRKVTLALQYVITEVLDEREWKRFDNEGRLFWNMNTFADYEEARRILEVEQG